MRRHKRIRANRVARSRENPLGTQHCTSACDPKPGAAGAPRRSHVALRGHLARQLPLRLSFSATPRPSMGACMVHGPGHRLGLGALHLIWAPYCSGWRRPLLRRPAFPRRWRLRRVGNGPRGGPQHIVCRWWQCHSCTLRTATLLLGLMLAAFVLHESSTAPSACNSRRSSVKRGLDTACWGCLCGGRTGAGHSRQRA